MWTLVRFLHLAGMALFVGGQLALVLAVAPALRREPDDQAMRRVGRRFGVASAAALLVLIATGAAMASHLSLWSDGTLQAKLMVLVLIGVLLGLHISTPHSRGVSLALAASSLFVAWLGVKLTYG